MPQPESEPPEVPARFVTALKQSHKPSVFIPSTLDESILRTARRRLSKNPKPRFKLGLFLRWVTAGATIAVLVAILFPLVRKSTPAPTVTSLPGDLNGDGQINILDAFALAREVEAGTHPSAQWDLNGDGVVDKRDVATLAARAVSLPKGGRS